jgi:hypothetical protein
MPYANREDRNACNRRRYRQNPGRREYLLRLAREKSDVTRSARGQYAIGVTCYGAHRSIGLFTAGLPYEGEGFNAYPSPLRG